MANSDGRPGDGASQADAPAAFELVIRLDQTTGRVDIRGPIENRVLCYGMLETARDIIADMARKRQEAGLQVVRKPLPPNGMGN